MMAVGTSMLLLKFLEKEDMYGYQMIKELEERAKASFPEGGDTHPLLHTLELQGDIESFEQPAPTGRIRRYYRITPDGRKTLTGKKEE
ncbi:MAG: PadR family transcriptional regulator [Eisenbergiella massiliensis]